GGAQLLADPGEEPGDRVAVRDGRDLAALVPGPSPVEHDDIAAFDVAELVDQFVDQHPVPDEEGLLHRPGRDVEGLDHPPLDDERQYQGDHDQYGEFLPEGPLAVL